MMMARTIRPSKNGKRVHPMIQNDVFFENDFGEITGVVPLLPFDDLYPNPAGLPTYALDLNLNCNPLTVHIECDDFCEMQVAV